MPVQKLVSPKRARLALRVGVTGHRPKDLVKTDMAKLRYQVRNVLEQLSKTTSEVGRLHPTAYSPDPPILRVISPIAEGADRIVAQEALSLGFELQCPLPFERNEYEKDFATPESRTEYRALLKQATAVLELDGSRATSKRENESYAAVGRMVLIQCDVLIAIWDGQEARGEGGTGQIVREAMLHQIPTVWIHAQTPQEIKLRVADNDGTLAESAVDSLPGHLQKILAPPAPHSGPVAGRGKEKRSIDLRLYYFQERQPRWTLGFIWKSFINLVIRFRIGWPRIAVADFESTTEQEWEKEWRIAPGIPESVKAQTNHAFRSHYAWADRLADYYANLYRSSFLTNYLLAGGAVFLALFAYACGWTMESHRYYQSQWLLIAGELFVIVLITGITTFGRRKHWQERWIDYRLLAEHLRQMRFLAPLGRVTPFSRLPAHAAGSDIRNTWMYWHFRAVVRAAGMITARMNVDYLNACRLLLRDGLIVGNTDEKTRERRITGQLPYHRDNAARLHRLDHRLHLAGVALFVLTSLACIIHLLPIGHLVNHWLTFAGAVLPAFGAALYAIRSQGEFTRVVKRSEAMADKLAQVASELEDVSQTSSSPALGRVAESAADCMIIEVLDWRIMFQARPLTLP